MDADVGGGAFARVFLVRNEATQDLQAMKRYLARQTTVSQSAAERAAQTGTGQEISRDLMTGGDLTRFVAPVRCSLGMS